MSATARRAAFFDVDETLLAGKSIFEFLRHWLALAGDDGTRYEQVLVTARGRAAGGAEPPVLPPLRRRPACCARAGAGTKVRCSPTGFERAGLDAVAAHRAAGDLVVLCTELAVAADGTLTGEITRPMIGRGETPRGRGSGGGPGRQHAGLLRLRRPPRARCARHPPDSRSRRHGSLR